MGRALGRRLAALKVGVNRRWGGGGAALVRDDYDLMIRVGAAPPEAHYARRAERDPALRALLQALEQRFASGA